MSRRMNNDTKLNLLSNSINPIYQHKMCDCPSIFFKPFVLKGRWCGKTLKDAFLVNFEKRCN